MITNDIITKKNNLRSKFIGKHNINAIGISSDTILTIYSSIELSEALKKQIKTEAKPFDAIFNVAPIAKLS